MADKITPTLPNDPETHNPPVNYMAKAKTLFLAVLAAICYAAQEIYTHSEEIRQMFPGLKPPWWVTTLLTVAATIVYFMQQYSSGKKQDLTKPKV